MGQSFMFYNLLIVFFDTVTPLPTQLVPDNPTHGQSFQ